MEVARVEAVKEEATAVEVAPVARAAVVVEARVASATPRGCLASEESLDD